MLRALAAVAGLGLAAWTGWCLFGLWTTAGPPLGAVALLPAVVLLRGAAPRRVAAPKPWSLALAGGVALLSLGLWALAIGVVDVLWDGSGAAMLAGGALAVTAAVLALGVSWRAARA